MATPDDMKIDNLNGIWILNKKHSSNLEGMLKIATHINKGQTDIWEQTQQKINWILRKAMSLTDIRLETSTSHAPVLQGNKPTVTINSVLTPTIGNLASTSENRTLDWAAYHHSDYFFGGVTHRSCFVRGSSGTGDASPIRPEFELQIQPLHACLKRFLSGEIFLDNEDVTSTTDGFLVEEPSLDHEAGEGLWVHTHEKSVTSNWEAEQIWGLK
ncbi:hypothetical protein N7493_011158 [Penicillium malachiteum]|uniref:Uncharacterized protein n=1 Tax=Penicillium malachiteum TaxID=1324776 RepID=A0AAD6HBL8_9EURO|nr:hypothetical protein N7493_011158 [Penicillium malachiteum]